MSFEFRDAKREDIRLLILLAGGTGSGKTESAMRLATGLAGGQKFAVIDTENGRALHKADEYAFQHATLGEPFTPERYAEAVRDADAASFPVIVIDSGSHEYEGPGGVLDMQTEEFERMGSRDSARMSSWIEPKRRHKRMVQELLRAKAHVILCLRAEDKIEIVKQDGKTVVRPKESLIGAEGWIPICEKRLPFEATISLLLLQSNPGVPVPIKLERRHADLVSVDEQLSEETGARLAAWARGTDQSGAPALPPSEPAARPDVESAPQSSPDEPKKITQAQAKQLDVLVGSLRDRANAITTEQLYAALAKERNVDVEVMIGLREGARDGEGKLHWGPLRDSLNRVEASDLISRLKEKEAAVGAPA